MSFIWSFIFIGIRQFFRVRILKSTCTLPFFEWNCSSIYPEKCSNICLELGSTYSATTLSSWERFPLHWWVAICWFFSIHFPVIVMLFVYLSSVIMIWNSLNSGFKLLVSSIVMLFSVHGLLTTLLLYELVIIESLVSSNFRLLVTTTLFMMPITSR